MKFYAKILLVCLMAVSSIYQLVNAAGPWDDTWADSPDWGYQNWVNNTGYVEWVPVFEWDSNTPPTNNRRIELEWYNPGAGTDCDRLEPYSLTEYGGDWVDTWWTDNQCGGWGTDDERLTFSLKENNISSGVLYGVSSKATKVSSPGTSGETNVSFTCWLCSDDWLGKQEYNSSYNDAGSSP